MSDFTHIAWIDVETNGVELDSDLLSLAMIMTDMQFREVTTPFDSAVRVIQRDADIFYGRANDHVREMHTKTGLWDRLTDPELSMSLRTMDEALMETLTDVQAEPRRVILGGNVTRLDQNMLQRHLPKTYAHLDHHAFDVSPIAIFAKTQYGIPWFTGGTGTHEALTDVREAIEEAKYYHDALRNTLGDGHNS